MCGLTTDEKVRNWGVKDIHMTEKASSGLLESLGIESKESWSGKSVIQNGTEVWSVTEFSGNAADVAWQSGVTRGIYGLICVRASPKCELSNEYRMFQDMSRV